MRTSEARKRDEERRPPSPLERRLAVAVALEQVYGSEQFIEAAAFIDKLEDIGWKVVEA